MQSKEGKSLFARFVRIEGWDFSCLLAAPHGEVPEEIVVDFGKGHSVAGQDRQGLISFRLLPSSLDGEEPIYAEAFDD